ncbi:MAG: F0F1 ATP synthase subunit B [Patescibacteria group bacterium]|jgi:F-type H+-transporting ATPase subunit b|nr:F0F1 ATP synthase subunit B [Patescibacteria group bacterium]
MDSLIETFHIDLRLLVAQMINFAIVISVLYFFALKPLMKVMDERSKKIEKSIEEAKSIEEKLQKTNADYKEAMSNAKKEANLIMEKTNAQAEERKEEMLKKAKLEIGAVINEEKAKMQTEKAEVLKELKKEVAEMVVSSLEKVLDKNLDDKTDKELIKKIVE